ncbi:MAG: C40 family peptidase [Candidatus Sumerlaeia bacterium]|nr:C40 family peptidase [Candidatus Sumerlaeia bacterium]
MRIILIVIFVIVSIISSAQENRTPPQQVTIPQEEERRERHLRRFIKNFEIDENVPLSARLKFYVETFKNLVVYDPKSTWFNVTTTISNNGGVVLNGEVMFPQHKSGLEQTFNLLGFKEIDNRIKILPEDSDLKTTPFALVTSYSLWLRADVKEPRSLLDELIYGNHIWLLKMNEERTHYLAQVPNGYVGWVESKGIKLISHTSWQGWTRAFPKALILREIETSGEIKIKLPKGCILPVHKKEGETIYLKTPEDTLVKVSQKDVSLIEPNIEKGRESILAETRDIFGLRYRWAGFSPLGYDCSGFSRLVYLLRNVHLPRDADQQSAVGEIVAYRGYIEDLLPGDLLFFCNRFGKIGHVAISLGGKQFIHSAEPKIRINSLAPDSPDFDQHYAEVFVFARRIFPGGF